MTVVETIAATKGHRRSIAALLMFWHVTERSLRPLAATVSVALCAMASPLVWQGAQAKQYSSDVLSTVIVLALVQWLSPEQFPSRAKTFAAAVVGAIVVWLSQPVVFVLFAAGVWLLLHALRCRWLSSPAQAGAIATIGGAWAVSALAAVLVAITIISPELETFVYTFWSMGFPRNGSPLVVTPWLWERMVVLFGAGSSAAGGLSQLEYGALGAPAAVACGWKRLSTT